jgi:hypothetical protein
MRVRSSIARGFPTSYNTAAFMGFLSFPCILALSRGREGRGERADNA